MTVTGGLSFFTPHHGLVSANILSYTLVLSNGTCVTASSTMNSPLYSALKTGANNFGIVTSMTAKTIPCPSIWSGFLYMRSSQAMNVLRAFHEFVSRRNDSASETGPGKEYDSHAAGPIACFTYLHQFGLQAIAVHLAHTASSPKSQKWPVSFSSSAFARLPRLWSTTKRRSITSSLTGMAALNPAGRRQSFGTTTIKNDLRTLGSVHAAYENAIQKIKKDNVKGISWTLVLQPLRMDWLQLGTPDPVFAAGYATGSTSEKEFWEVPYVIVSFTVNWTEAGHDSVVERIVKEAVEEIEMVARQEGTLGTFLVMNYCAGWQRPWGMEEGEYHTFLRGVRGVFDPDGLFQDGCGGVFKLGMEVE